MRLGLVDRRREPVPAGPAALVCPWETLAGLARDLGPVGWRVDVVLIDDDDMAGLNLAYRDAEGPTDVLSFAYLETGAASGRPPVLRAGERGARHDLRADDTAAPIDGDEPLAGEVVLAPGFIVRRCGERGWDPAHEMALLVVHGCLHILGWEHEQAAEQQQMRGLEASILGACGLPHPLADGSQET